MEFRKTIGPVYVIMTKLYKKLCQQMVGVTKSKFWVGLGVVWVKMMVGYRRWGSRGCGPVVVRFGF